MFMKKSNKPLKATSVDSNYTEGFADDLSEGEQSVTAMNIVLDELERDANDIGFGGTPTQISPTVLQTLGPNRYYLYPQKAPAKKNGWGWCLLLVLGLLIGVGAGIGITYALTNNLPAGRNIVETKAPTAPTVVITEAPTTPFPSKSPTLSPTKSPTKPGETPNPTNFPTTASPTTKEPTTSSPTTKSPTLQPTKSPSPAPTRFPTTLAPTKSPTKHPTETPNPCKLALGDDWKYCSSPTTLVQCVLNEFNERVPGPVEECGVADKQKPVCRCPSGKPFDAYYGCVRADNVNKNCNLGL